MGKQFYKERKFRSGWGEFLFCGGLLLYPYCILEDSGWTCNSVKHFRDICDLMVSVWWRLNHPLNYPGYCPVSSHFWQDQIILIFLGNFQDHQCWWMSKVAGEQKRCEKCDCSDLHHAAGSSCDQGLPGLSNNKMVTSSPRLSSHHIGQKQNTSKWSENSPLLANIQHQVSPNKLDGDNDVK